MGSIQEQLEKLEKKEKMQRITRVILVVIFLAIAVIVLLRLPVIIDETNRVKTVLAPTITPTSTSTMTQTPTMTSTGTPTPTLTSTMTLTPTITTTPQPLTGMALGSIRAYSKPHPSFGNHYFQEGQKLKIRGVINNCYDWDWYVIEMGSDYWYVQQEYIGVLDGDATTPDSFYFDCPVIEIE